jgi:hypothetical protein
MFNWPTYTEYRKSNNIQQVNSCVCFTCKRFQFNTGLQLFMRSFLIETRHIYGRQVLSTLLDQAVQQIWSSPLTEMKILGSVPVISRLQLQCFTLPSSYNATATTALLLPAIFLRSRSKNLDCTDISEAVGSSEMLAPNHQTAHCHVLDCHPDTISNTCHATKMRLLRSIGAGTLGIHIPEQ